MGAHSSGGGLDAQSTRLYSLAVDEILASQNNGGTLPKFLIRAICDGPSWVCLLRLYMKHERLEDAVQLLVEQVEAASTPPISSVFGAPKTHKRPLQDFPVSLAVQLRRYASQQAEKGGHREAAKQLEKLDRVLHAKNWRPDSRDL